MIADASQLAVSLLPVLAFLVLLRFLDSFKLLTLRRTIECILVGCAVAAVCYVINSIVLAMLPPTTNWYLHFGAPVLEEILKAAYIVWLIRRSRVGFMVDAAIAGFAIGAGFAVVENVTYLHYFAGASPLLWILRGFGTAMMHGGNTAMVGIIGSSMAERRDSRSLPVFLPGLVLAIVLHSIYNQGLLSPQWSAVITLVGIPIALAIVFMQSEESLRKWLGDRLDKDVDLLHAIATAQFSDSHAGRYLRSLKSTFQPEVVGDMLCLLQLSLELSAQAKGDLLMREAGFDAPPDPTLPSKFQELRYLEKSIGPAGCLAMSPLLPKSLRDQWQLQNLVG